MSARWFAILHPYDPAIGAEVPLYMSTHGLKTAPDDDPPNVSFDPRLVSGPTITQTLWTGGRLGGGSSPEIGNLSFQNADRKLDDDWRRYRWLGRKAIVGQHEVGQSLSSAIAGAEYVGVTGQLGHGDRKLILPLKGKSVVLDRPVQTKRFGAHARALRLNDAVTTDRLGMPLETNPAPWPEWTVECWVMARGLPSSGSTRNGLFFFNDTSPQASMSCYYAGNLSSDYRGVWFAGTFWNDYPLADGVWRHLALRYRSQEVSIVVDGELVAEGTISRDHAAAVAGPWLVGDFDGTGDYAFDGAVSRVRVWSSALELSDIRARMLNGLSGGEQHLIGSYPIQDGTDVLGTDDEFVFDEAVEPLGPGSGQIVGSPSWIDTGEAVDASLYGTEKLLPVGNCPLFAPDLADPTIDLYRVSSDAHREVRVFEGGRQLTGTEPVDTSGGGLLIPADSALDFGVGDTRSVLIDLEVNDLSSDGKLLHAANGTVLWDWVLATDGSISLTMTTSLGGSKTLTSPVGIIAVGGRYRILVALRYARSMRLMVNKRPYGSKALPNDAGNLNPGQIGVGQNDTGTGGSIGASITRFAMFSKAYGLRNKHAKIGGDLKATDADLVAGYKIEEKSGGTIIDIGPHGIDGTVTGSKWSKAQYELTNNALDGCLVRLERPASKAIRVETEGWFPLGHALGEAATIPYQASMQTTGSFTVFGRARYSTDGLIHYFLDRTGSLGSGRFYLRQWTNGQLHFVVESDTIAVGQFFDAPSDVVDGQWLTAAGVWDEAEALLKTYVDGVPGPTLDITGLAISSPACVSDLRLLAGSAPQNAGGQRFGWVNRALNADEIAAMAYTTKPFLSDPDLMGLWPCNEKPGDLCYDLGPNSFHSVSVPIRVDGYEPKTATEISTWLALRDNEDLSLSDIDVTSQREFEALAGSAQVGEVLRSQTQRAAVDKLVKPLGWHKFNPAGEWQFGQFWLPDIRLVPEFDGANKVTIPDDPSIRLEAEVGGEVWGLALSLYVDQLPSSTVRLIEKENNYRLSLRSDGLLEWKADIDRGSGTAFLGPDIYTVAPIALGTWLNIGVGKDPASPTSSPIYIDGETVATTDNTPAIVSHTGSYEDLVIGDGLVGKIANVSFWRRLLPDAITYRHLLPAGDEFGVGGVWPLLELEGLDAENRVAGGPAGTWSSLPERLPRLTNITGDAATDEVSRHTWADKGQGVRQLQSPTPTSRETVAFRVRTDPYGLNELVEITREDALGVSEMIRPYDKASQPIPSVDDPDLTGEPGPVVETALQHQADAIRALEVMASTYGRTLEYYEVRDLQGRWGTAGQQLRFNADLANGETAFLQPLGGKNFLVVTLRYDPRRGRHLVRLLGVAP